MATTDERLAQLETQQSLQSQAIAQILADHYDDGAESAKSALVALNEPKYKGLVVVEKENAPKGDGGGGNGDHPVTWVGSPNHYAGDLHAGGVWALCIHTMAGTLESCDAWFGNPASQVSSHYGVGLDGALHQYVALTNGSWANGVLEGGNAWAPYFDSSDNPNHHSITIETEDNGSGGQVVTDEQYAATLAACRLALAQWPDITTVTVHRAISPQSRPACAGDRWWGSGRVQDLATDLGLDVLL